MRRELESLLAQDVEPLKRRSAELFDQLRAPGAPLVLVGAGGLGRKTLAVLARKGVQVSALADNSAQLHGTRVHDLEVLSVKEAAQRYGTSAVFIVTVFVGSESVRRQLRDLGCRTVLPFYPLFWKYADDLLPHYVFDLPHKVIEAAPAVLQAWSLLADDASRVEYLANVRWRLDPEFKDLPPPAAHEIYFPPDVFALEQDEFFVDCGGFDGDTLSSFLKRTPAGTCDAVVFEPDPANFSKLEAFARALPPDVTSRIELRCAAIGAHPSVLRLESGNSTASSLSSSGEIEVPCLTIDEVLGDRAATFIKMDIEGAEPEAIEGAAKQIRRNRPLLALSAYHSQDHLWRLPLLVHSLDPDYRYFLRHYAAEPVDALVAYAVPARRVLQPGRSA